MISDKPIHTLARLEIGLRTNAARLLDGEVYMKGRYLTDAERVTFSRAALGESEAVSS